jgi:hypothetical protein
MTVLEREPLKDQLSLHGAASVLTALAALVPPMEEAMCAIADAQTYFTRNAARMDYPRFVARPFPIGSAAVESACKGLVEARLKQAGMRWVRFSCPAPHRDRCCGAPGVRRRSWRHLLRAVA